ncbi:NAD-dependent epimerase/dehydratase family protein [Acidisoma sp. C75]
MKVVLTGASSFVGCHLGLGFAAAGHAVVGTVSRHGAADGVRALRLQRLAAAGVRIAPLDLRQGEAISAFAQEEAPALWLQHAGYTHAYGSPAYDLAEGFALNVQPLTAIFEAMARLGGGAIITGSNAEYADSEAAHGEEEACWPATPYGLSKLSETLRALQLGAQLGVPVRIARIFLPFGPLDAPDKLLPSVRAALRAGERIALSPCLQARDFLHVADVVRGYLALAADLARGGGDIFNLCAGQSPRLREVILEMAASIGADPRLCDFGAIPMRAGESMVMRGSAGKAQRLLGWVPSPWGEAVRRFVSEE